MASRPDDWSFGGTWPFEPHYFSTPDGPLHYVDEGRGGATAVLVHGNPTWGYMFRNLVPALRDAGLRVVVPDLLGFGRSHKPVDRAVLSVGRHVDRLSALLEAIGVSRVTLVAHDWGAPIALAWASRHPSMVERLALMNTFAPVLPGPLGGGADLRAVRRAVRLPGVARLLYQRRNVMIEDFLLGQGLARPEALSPLAREAYRAPHPTLDSRAGIAAFPLQIPRRSDEPAAKLSRTSIEGLESRLRDLPAALIWGAMDPLFGEDVLEEWRALLPHAQVTVLPKASHYVIEDEPETVVAAVLRCVRAGS